MPIKEEDCQFSRAVERLAFNTSNNSVYVLFRGDSKRRVYEYMNAPTELMRMLVDQAVSKGKLVALVKAFLEESEGTVASKILASFPSEKSLKENKTKNFTANWLAIISAPTAYPQQYLENNLSLLDSQIVKNPTGHISRAPYRYRKEDGSNQGGGDDSSVSSLPTLGSSSSDSFALRSQASSISNSKSSRSSLGNAFAALSLDEDISDDGSIDDGGGNDGDDDGDDDSDGDGDVLSEDRFLQRRYLRHMLICSIAEGLRFRAVEAVKARSYADSFSALEGAYAYINQSIAETSLWFAILREGIENDSSDSLRDGHSKQQLVSLFESMHLIRDDSERSRESALQALSSSLARIEKKLMDLMMSRDAMRRKMGGSWKAPRAGGGEFRLSPLAEQLKAMEMEARAIAGAINGIKRLSLVSVSG